MQSLKRALCRAALVAQASLIEPRSAAYIDAQRGEIQSIMGATAPHVVQPLATESRIPENIMTRKFSARCVLIMTFFLLPGSMSPAARPRKLTFGVYAGWSAGASEERRGSGWKEDFGIDLSLGAYV
jgi:hypothetical protein